MRNKIPHQPPEERIKNFLEVALGFSESEAQKEASRCLQCKNKPCVKGCPVGIDIPAFIKLIQEGRQREALEKIKEKNNLPAVCGRVCPQENQCEAVCILNKKKIPLNIGALERYAADYALTHKPEPIAHRRQNLAAKIAVVGSGPAGLTCAADLAKRGFEVTLFESLHTAGGVLVYGIPEFRLPKKIVQDEVDYIRGLGVELKVDTLIGNTFTLEDLFKSGFKAAFIAVGAGLPQFLGIEGENLPGVYSANEFLTRVNLMKAYKFPEYATPINIGKRTVVIGGGNVALDSARVGLRLGSTVTLVYRRTENEMPGRLEEIKNAREEGVALKILTQPIRIIANKTGSVGALECIKMQLGEPDSSGRKRPVPLENSNFILETDTLIIAIGQNPNPLLPRMTKSLQINKNGTIVVDENLMTSIPGVFAGGDITSGADTVISAMGAGKKAALVIEQYLKE
ncbi:MAG: NADPH-dependent glutamate synthase [Candidatus Omnitrophota bacterium]|jgi:glutamate synthase (NADPH/NADH) small chain